MVFLHAQYAWLSDRPSVGSQASASDRLAKALALSPKEMDIYRMLWDEVGAVDNLVTAAVAVTCVSLWRFTCGTLTFCKKLC
jgi:hypothetical protein